MTLVTNPELVTVRFMVPAAGSVTGWLPRLSSRGIVCAHAPDRFGTTRWVMRRGRDRLRFKETPNRVSRNRLEDPSEAQLQLLEELRAVGMCEIDQRSKRAS